MTVTAKAKSIFDSLVQRRAAHEERCDSVPLTHEPKGRESVQRMLDAGFNFGYGHDFDSPHCRIAMRDTDPAWFAVPGYNELTQALDDTFGDEG